MEKQGKILQFLFSIFHCFPSIIHGWSNYRLEFELALTNILQRLAENVNKLNLTFINHSVWKDKKSRDKSGYFN